MSRTENHVTRSGDPKTLAIVAQAVAEHFTIDLCPCGGPRIYSKVKPIAKCFGCGARLEMKAVRPKEQRVRCGTCKKRFYSVVAYENCPSCREHKAKQAKIEAKWGPNQQKVGKGMKKADQPLITTENIGEIE